MCGIAGVLRRGQADFPVGAQLLEMARCLQHRGLDSSGAAIFGAPRALGLQFLFPEGADSPDLSAFQRENAGLSRFESERGGFRAQIGSFSSDCVPTLEKSLAGGFVSGLGHQMSVYKAVGRIEELQFQLENAVGTHGIAHLRLATESRIDPAHAQPFWGRPFPDIAVTHNGHITNYFKLRQKFEARGFGFASHNDSEIIGVFLGDKMDAGFSFLEALQAATRELDGSFSFIAACAQGLGVARDPLATKPLLFVENDEGVTLASEPQALYHVGGPNIKIREIKPLEVKNWSVEE